MGLLEIVKYPDPRLRKKCAPAKTVDDHLRKLLDDMAETMYAAPGIGLAAPQVGELQRAIVVNVGDDEETGERGHLYKVVNPEIVTRSGTIEWEEGCLSIPGVKEVVRRSDAILVKGLDENGKEIEIDAVGLLAVCFQHEIDHIDGVLFFDRLSRLKRELLKAKLAKLGSQS